jgi:hypothetical protein
MTRPEHSLKAVESPLCPNCSIEMRWYRSELIKFVPKTSLHLFSCLTCSLIAESETVQEPIWVLPDEFAVPPVRFLTLAA